MNLQPRSMARRLTKDERAELYQEPCPTCGTFPCRMRVVRLEPMPKSSVRRAVEAAIGVALLACVVAFAVLVL